jgi:hypothetical protein
MTWSCAFLGLALRQSRRKGDHNGTTAARGDSALDDAFLSRHRMRPPFHLVPVWLVWSGELGHLDTVCWGQLDPNHALDGATSQDPPAFFFFLG